MTGTAIAMMIVSIVTVWGGLAASIAYIATHHVEPDDGED